ncbi:helix-turn-helix transcriptional regulator [Caloramator sp. mosi_1]|uniref:helix-turn-helix domain-containing protein n=1 Tax=Caloramator sp. mosi_1 TaxID=3023090 RepID=UPI002361E7B0|nr:helix-turn-helix transcriptional regulator [Caloramator sp. mosi_1]WDC83744.1 helix-turn-helix transcriptional regulator [Caloramator sp. mosi_1]
MDNIQKEFGNMVRKYRKEKGYSTQKLAELLGISVGLLNNIENGKSDVFKLEVLSQIFYQLNIPILEFLNIFYKSFEFNATFSTFNIRYFLILTIKMKLLFP